MESEEIAFLKDQVSRLSGILGIYQERYGTLEPSRSVPEAPDTPWITDQQLMAPLLTEYDTQVNGLKEQLESREQEQQQLRGQLHQLMAENGRLTRELKTSIESRLHESSADGPTVPTTVEDDQVITNLQHQLQLVTQEKDTMADMYYTAEQEVEKLQRDVQSTQMNPRLKALDQQYNQIKTAYSQTVAELNSELENLQEELRHSKSELNVAHIQVTELRRTLDDMRHRMVNQEHEKSVVVGSKSAADGKVGLMMRDVNELAVRLDESDARVQQLQQDKKVLEQRITELQKKSSENEQRAYEAALQVRDSCQLAEGAMLEKDSAIVRERQAQEEVSRLQDAISNLVDEAGARTRQEVDIVKKQCNQNITRLMEEIHGLELEVSEKQAQVDRIVREKRAAESELEKIYKEGMVQGKQASNSYEELTRRACEAERMRDESSIKLDGAQNELKRTQMTTRQEKSHLQAEVDQLKDRLVLMNNEFEMANDDRVRLMEQVDELKKKVHSSDTERSQAQRNLTKEVTILEKDSIRKERDWTVKVQTLEDTHRRAMMDIRSMLAANQRMSAKWKEECQGITLKFESKVKVLREELSREKKRNSELSKVLKEAKEKTSDTELMLSEYTRNIHRMENRVREAESRAVTRTVHVTPSVSRQARDIVQERKKMQRELERSLQESKASFTSDPEPLAMSDLAPPDRTRFTNGVQLHPEPAANR